MIKKTIVLFCVFLYLSNSIKGQTYGITSFEGPKATIKLHYKPASGMLTIRCLNDSIKVNDFMSVHNVKLLNHVFLQVDYVKRAGSNEDTINQLLLYVSGGKICQAMHVNTLRTYDMRPDEYELFKMKVILTGNNLSTYGLKLDIHDENKSIYTPKSNYKFNKIVSLKFDRNNKVFYNAYEPINGNYKLHTLRNVKDKKLKINVPLIKIGKDTYYYINGDWFNKDKNDFYSISL